MAEPSKRGALLAWDSTVSELDVNPAAEASLTAAPAPLLRPEHTEGVLARVIEQQAAKIPSHWFWLGATRSMGVSLMLELTGRQRESRFIGQWAEPLLILGMYNRFVKILGTPMTHADFPGARAKLRCCHRTQHLYEAESRGSRCVRF
jgi:hypothetical protein